MANDGPAVASRAQSPDERLLDRRTLRTVSGYLTQAERASDRSILSCRRLTRCDSCCY